MANRLDTLPTELLDLILEAVDDLASIDVRTRYDNRVRVFSSLSRSCRVLHNAAAPYLYRSFESLKNGEGVRAFATTLCERPDLAKLVQVVNLFPSRANINGPPSERQAELFTPVIRSLGFGAIGASVVRALLRALKGCHTAEMVIIMCLATSMKILQISNYDHQTKAKEERVCRRCPDMAYCLHAIFSPARLRNVETDKDGNPPYRRLNNCYLFGKYIDPTAEQHRGTTEASISTLLQLPSMRALTCTGLRSDAFTDLVTLPDNRSNITTLELVRGNISSMNIYHTLRACRRLVNLEISWESMMSGGEDDPDQTFSLFVGVSTLTRALALHKDSLRILSMTNRLDQGTAWKSEPAIGSLRDFSHLRELKIDDGLLLGDSSPPWSTLQANEVFPVLLKVLVVNCSEGFELLKEAARSLGRFRGPRLEAIEINFPWWDETLAGVPEETWVDATLARPRSEQVTGWSLDLENHDEGLRLTFSCWRGTGQAESIPATLECCVQVMEVGGVEGLANVLYPPEPISDLVDDVNQLHILESDESTA